MSIESEPHSPPKEGQKMTREEGMRYLKSKIKAGKKADLEEAAKAQEP